MKTVISLITLALALSLCNLLGRRSANNSNSNTSSTETTSAENANASVSESAPPSTAAAPPGVQSLPNPNQNSAAKAPLPPKTISGGVLNGRATKLVQPPYPAIARAAHASGPVNVQVVIDEDGNVISATAVSGHPLLKPAAAAAARASKFQPTIVGGEYVKVSGVIIYNFVEN
jgi:protein TonB